MKKDKKWEENKITNSIRDTSFLSKGNPNRKKDFYIDATNLTNVNNNQVKFPGPVKKIKKINNLSFGEKYIKFMHKKTYWKIHERGAFSVKQNMLLQQQQINSRNSK